jgi:hypothetical protein
MSRLVGEFVTIGVLFGMLIAVVIMLITQETEQNNPGIEITFPAEDIRCVQQDGKIVFCESYKAWGEE